MKLVYATLIFCFFFSCNQNIKTKMADGQDINTAEYLKTKQIISKNVKGRIEFRIVSNPFEWSKNDRMLLYINNQVAFVGDFKLDGTLYIDKIKDNELVHCKLEIIRDNKLYIFENKSNFNWNNEYKFIYIGLFPENPTTDNVYFFPQINQVIQ